MDEHLAILARLQSLRGSVPTYFLIDGIGPKTWIQVENNLKNLPHGEEIDVILVSGGGSADDAYRIIRAFRDKYTTVNIIIPFWAKSAATLMSLGASRLVLHKNGELGPIDAQIRKEDERNPEEEMVSALDVQSSLAQIEKRSKEGVIEMFATLRDPEKNPEIFKIGRKELAEMLFDYSARFYVPLLQKIEPMEMGQRARILDIGRMYARRILTQYTPSPKEKIDELLDFLVYECPEHGYVVDYHILKSFLPFVIRADEAPFGQEYYNALGELSLLIIEKQWPTANSFLSSLAPQPVPSTIETPGATVAQSNG